MSGKVTGFILDHYPYGGAEKLVAIALADEADDRGNNIYPGVARLAQRCRMTERGVQKILRRIESRQIEQISWFKKVRSGRGGRRNTNHYACPMDDLMAAINAQTTNIVQGSETQTPNTVQGNEAQTPNAVQSKPTQTPNPVQGNNSEQYSGFVPKPRTQVHKTPNGGSPYPLDPYTHPPARAHTREAAGVPPGALSEPALAFGDVMQALHACGTPPRFCTNQNSRDVIRGWQEAGATHDDLQLALNRAVQRNKGGAIGPRYLDPFIKQVVTERLAPNGGHHGSKNTGHHTSRAGERMASLFAIIQGDE